MKAIRFHAFGGPEVLRYEDVEEPTPGPGQVRIRVAATSCNDVDIAVRAGDLQAHTPVRLPYVPGVDVTGTVDALGLGVDGVAIGERVVGLLAVTDAGAAAEYVLAPADVLTGVPRGISLIELAALPLAALTAWQALFDHGGLTGGQRVLIHGADSVVGGYAMQLAEEWRAEVLGTAGSCTVQRIVTAGAGGVLGSPHTDLAAALREPVDVMLVLSPINPQFAAVLQAMIRPGGVLVTTEARVRTLTEAERGVRSVYMAVRSDADQLADLVARVSTGELVIDLARQVALADLAEIHEQAGQGGLPSKVVVLPAGA